MYKILYLAVISLFATENLHAEIVGIGALKDKKSDHKVVILYDLHDIELNQIAKQQQIELTKLICALSQLKNKSSFFIEYPYLTTNFKTTYNFTTIHVPIKDALAHQMKSGSIQYIPFDKRAEVYFWVRDIHSHFLTFKKALKQGHAMPKEYNQASIESYLNALQTDEKDTQEIYEKLPAETQKLVAERLKLYPQAIEFIKEQTAQAKLTIKDHFLKLFENIQNDPSWTEKSANILTSVQLLNSDINLLYAILNDKNSLSIVHAGMYHAYHLEKALLAAGFEDALPEQDLKNGLKAEDLTNLIKPTKVLDSILQPLSQFLGLCDACGKETTKKCGVCKKTYYCNRECQKATWKVHKINCKKPTIIK